MPRRTHIDDYTPTMNPDHWAIIGDFVRAAVIDTADKTPYPERELLTTTSRHVLWCWQTAGCDLDRSSVFSRALIAYSVPNAFPELTAASKGNRRSQLLRLSEVLLGPGATPPRLPPMPPSQPHAPYSRPELVSLHSWAAYQPTVRMRRNAQALLAFGAGAGLTARELSGVHRKDISWDADGVVVTVRERRTRSVPLLQEWEKTLIEAVESTRPGDPVFRPGHSSFYPNIVTNFVSRSAGVELKPQTQRLRATWIVTHLTAATPVVALMDAGGVTSLEAFTRYARFVPPREADVVNPLLRHATERAKSAGAP